MMDMLARTGRQRQRYEGEFRLVAGCIPYRWKENGDNCIDNLENRLEVLMISSPDRHDLVFPKGGWEDDETVEEAACREALEEAGVEGILDSKELGAWEFRSKSSQSCCGMEGYCRGVMFALQVTKEYELWAEKSSHERRWLDISEASKLCRYDWMREALQAFVSNLSKEETGQDREDDFLEETDDPTSYLSEEYEDQAGETVLEEANQPTSYMSEEYEGQAREDVFSEEADIPMSYQSEEYERQAREIVPEEANNPTSHLSEEYEEQTREDNVLEEADHPTCYEDIISEEADNPMSCPSEEYEEQAEEDVLEVADHPIPSPQKCYSFDTQRLDDPPMVALY